MIPHCDRQRRARPVENMQDRARANSNRDRNLRPRQPEAMTVPKDTPEAHHAGPLHRAFASSIRSTVRVKFCSVQG